MGTCCREGYAARRKGIAARNALPPSSAPSVPKRARAGELFSQEVPNGGDGVLPEHAWPAVAHHRANLLPHLGFVAVVFAGVAARLDFHLPATARSLGCIGVKLGALLAYGFAADRLSAPCFACVVRLAIQGDHLGDGFLFAFALFRDFRAVLHDGRLRVQPDADEHGRFGKAGDVVLV